MSKQPPPAPTASATGPCPTIIQIVGRPGTGRLPRTIAPPDHPQLRGCLQVKQSKLYTDIRLKLTCPYCNTRSLKYACGPCECHLCEDWLGCVSQTKCRDLLKCSSCFFSKDIAGRRFPYRYLWE